MVTESNQLGKGSYGIESVTEQEWKSELKDSAARYHVIGAWVAIIFDPLFGITDYINIPDDWFQIFLLRLFVAFATFVALMLYKRKKLSVFAFVSVPLFLISFQNAYTYSVIGAEDLLGHNLNYLALFMGAGLFLLWPMTYSWVAIAASAAASFGFILLNPDIQFDDFMLKGGILLISAVAFSILLIQARYNSRVQEIKARLALGKALDLTERQKADIEEKNGLLADQADALGEANQVIESINRQLLGQNETLEATVQQRTQDLRQTSSERDQLVYRLSHDFRTPMVNIQSMVSMLEHVTEPTQRAGVLDRIRQSVEKFDGLVRDMERFPVYARLELQPEKVALEPMVQDIWAKLSEEDAVDGDAILLTGAPEASVRTDAEKLSLVLQCLLSNARRFRMPGAAARVEVKVESLRDGCRIVLRDHGPGIPAEVLPKVCDMFFRGHPSGNGVGLGLYLSKGLTEQLGGTLAISSEVGAGTEVVVELPEMK